jgi:hypothetical protein
LFYVGGSAGTRGLTSFYRGADLLQMQIADARRIERSRAPAFEKALPARSRW